MRPRKDLDFAVDDAGGNERIFKTFDAACGFAVGLAASDGRPHQVNVLAYSRAGARAFAGDEGARQYDEDPDASVFERIVVTADARGRVA